MPEILISEINDARENAEKKTKKALQYSSAITIIYVVVETEMPVRHFTLL